MSNKSNVSSQAISLPKGGGAQHGIGEKFSPDLHTGTGNFTVPIALPPGRNGFQPQLSLVYSTGTGNGPFGLGWNLGVPGVSRKTSHGLPQYKDYSPKAEERDIFILSGAEDLVPLPAESPGPPLDTTEYRPRTEGLFARITHHHSSSNNYWEVRSKDGLVSLYGTRQGTSDDPAVVANPDPLKRRQVFAWKLTETRDPFGNLIKYRYTPDKRDPSKSDTHEWNQPLLKQIQYADYDDQNQRKFLISVTFEYEDGERPDSFSEYRAGFEIRTTKRCKAITIQTHADLDRSVRTYSLNYETDPCNGASLLRQIKVGGYDDQDVLVEELPPLEFGYTRFDEQQRKFFPVTGADLPPFSLAHRDYEQVDLFGNGLPDILQMNGTVRYWRNLGHGKFDLPREMREAPADFGFADSGVQLVDADGDGRTDLLVTNEAFSGYFPLRFGGLWDRRSSERYSAPPSFNLEDPEVRLVDLDGDGITDAIRSGSRMECFFNDADPRKAWQRTRWIERQQLEVFTNVNFSDPRVRWADLTGDGLQDIALVHDGSIEYWPNLGHGNWGKRIHMNNSPRFPSGYDPKRILVGDVDGDGLADLVYVDHGRVMLWLNQSGNGWSHQPFIIQGTPPVTDMDAVRLTDLLGTGVGGLLWSADVNSLQRTSMFFLDFTGGVKPYVLSEMNNHMGAVTKVKYESSTHFYLEDQKSRGTRWQTPLPFPVQVVSRVEVIDGISRGKLTTEYRYHHGYWDGAEREFRGFGMVEQFDTETFCDYKRPGLHGEASFAPVELVHFSPPIRTKTWFHQGPVGDEFGEWGPAEYEAEFWLGDRQQLGQRDQTVSDLQDINDRRVKRDALRTLRGQILRTELYAMDGMSREDRPYTVTESLFGIREESEPGTTTNDEGRRRIFFPHPLAQRTTQWERGDEPMTQFTFTDYRDENGDFDPFGRPLWQTVVACPRGWRGMSETSNAYLSTRTRTEYAEPLNAPQPYIHDRVSRTSTFEITNKTAADEGTNNASRTVLEIRDLAEGHPALQIISQTLNYYDGGAFVGLTFKQVGKYGALVRTESLVLTSDILEQAFATEPPPYFAAVGSVVWTPDYPLGFQSALPVQAGYIYRPAGADHAGGYYVMTERRRYDFHDDPVGARGLLKVKRDPLGHDTTINRYDFQLLPREVMDAVGLETTATYDPRHLQPSMVTDPNGNQTLFTFRPLGLPDSTWVKGKLVTEGDRQRQSVKLEYDFLAYANRGQPIFVHTTRQVYHDTETDASIPQAELNATIESYEYSDGFGRLLQTRTQGDDVRFGDEVFGSGESVLPSEQSGGAGGAVIGRRNTSSANPNVVVSGWQVYDNKGRVVEKHEPFFAEGWAYAYPGDPLLNESQKVTMFYDPRGHVIRTLNSDGSEQRVISGVPDRLDDPTNPDEITPTAWEAYTYDANDNAGRTHPNDSKGYRHHWNTPSSALFDALGRATVAVERNRAKPASLTDALPKVEEYRTRSTYDIQGNLLTISDALNRVAYSHVYDLAKRPLRIDSIDAGTRIVVSDAAGNEIERRDSKGALALRSYDILHRPDRIWARDDAVQSMTLREVLSYGDGGRSDQTPQERGARRASNSLGKPVLHQDEAGELSVGAYDFRGNLLAKTRKVIADESIIAALDASGGPARSFTVDWDNPPSLEGADETSMTYDALNRIKTVQYPEDVGDSQQPPARKVLRPHYNRAGALERVTLDAAIYVERIAYNAKGQRILIAYGNGIMTRYAYDPKTFRLARLRTDRYSNTTTYTPGGAPLQDFAYEYDLGGNILAVHERVPGCGVLNNPDSALVTDLVLKSLLVAGDALIRRFEYDPLYRLTRATGREAANIPKPRPWQELAWKDQKGDVVSGFYAPSKPPATTQNNAPELTAKYWETYDYDPAGNMLKLAHGGNGVADWARHFGMSGFTPKQWKDKVSVFVAGGSPAWGTQGNRLTNFGTNENHAQSHTFDSNGNLTRERTNRHFHWDYADHMIAFADRATAASPASKEAIYLYDAGGQRIKKLVRLQTGEVETTTYLDAIFEHHRWSKPGQPTIENNTLHVMDNQSRIAMVRVGDAFSGDGAPNALVKYNLGDHLGSSSIVIGGVNATGGTLINREEYFPYGETSFGSFGRKRYRFTGKERDEESGLNYHAARYLAPWLGRWISCDPLGARDSINLYRYLSRSPTIARDGTGKQTELFTSVDMLRKLIPTPPIEQLVDRQTRVPWTITTPTGSPTVGIALNLSTRAGPPGQIEVSGNPGHAVLYARDANGSAMILSFGPRPFLSPLDGMTWNGERPRPPDPLYKIERTDEYQVYEFRVSLDQLKKAEDFIKKFSANPLGYSIGTNCTTVVVQGAKQSGIPVPEGEGMIVYRGLHQGVAPNPVALDEQLRARGAVTTTRNANTFFGDVLNPAVDEKGASKITATSVPAQDWGDGGRGSRSRRSAAEVK